MTNKDKISDIDDFQNSNTYNTSDDSDDSKFTDLYTKTMDNVTMSQETRMLYAQSLLSSPRLADLDESSSA